MKCLVCDEEIYIPEVNDQNIDSRMHAFRKRMAIIGNADIQNILTIYHIGKRPLSKLVGWSELTITRYLSGATPTKEYSDILKKY